MKYLYIANWKMNMPYRKGIDFCIQNKDRLFTLAQSANIVICPSFVALAPIAEILKNTAISIGAQNCSAYKAGSYTGEISAQSLAEIGITYCIVGHSERRMYFEETTENIIKKVNLLLRSNIKPIICIGETQEQFESKATLMVLTEQLKPILENISPKNKQIIIAYEPVWSIGTGIVPENTYLEEVFAWITKLLHNLTSDCAVQLLYGGSITEKNINQLKNVPNINGFLIGGASADFASLKNIMVQGNMQ